MSQTIRPLSQEMIKRLDSQRNWVKGHYSDNPEESYSTVKGKLELLDIIITSNWINKNEKNKLQCLGVTLGDTIVQDLEFSWIEVEDEYGIDPAIKLKETSLILFPLTMISKRIENGEIVNIMEYYNMLKAHVLELKDKVDKK